MRGVTEVWHIAHFWVSYGRFSMLDDLWDGKNFFGVISKLYGACEKYMKHAALQASGTLKAVLPCLDNL